MKIRGNTVSTSGRRSDYSQSDPGKSDYILNKPDLEPIRNLAGNALPKSGGTMTGPIAMGGNRITGMAVPTESGDAATKGYVEGYVDSKRVTKTATLSAEWAGNAAPYTQTVTISGILETDMPHISPVYSGDLDTAVAQREAWGMVSQAVCSAGVITFTCFEDKPEAAIPIQVEVMR